MVMVLDLLWCRPCNIWIAGMISECKGEHIHPGCYMYLVYWSCIVTCGLFFIRNFFLFFFAFHLSNDCSKGWIHFFQLSYFVFFYSFKFLSIPDIECSKQELWKVVFVFQHDMVMGCVQGLVLTLERTEWRIFIERRKTWILCYCPDRLSFFLSFPHFLISLLIKIHWDFSWIAWKFRVNALS